MRTITARHLAERTITLRAVTVGARRPRGIAVGPVGIVNRAALAASLVAVLPHFAQWIVHRAARGCCRTALRAVSRDPIIADVLIARLAVAGLAAGGAVLVGAATAAAAAAGCRAAAAARITRIAARVLLKLLRFAGRRGQAGGFLEEILGQRLREQLHLGEPLDIAQIVFLIRRHIRNRDAIGAGPRGAPDAVDILFGHVGHFEVKHVAYTRNIDPARGDIGRNQHRSGTLAESVERGGALRLALVAMDRSGLHSGGDQVAHHAVGTMLGPGEHQRAIDLAISQTCPEAEREQSLLFALIKLGHILFDPLDRGRLRGDFDPHRVADELLAKVSDRLGHGGREEQALAFLGQHVGHALERHDKAQVHHLVGLVEHENLDIAQRQRALIDQIEQPPRRGDQNVDPAGQRAGLLAHRHAAKDALHGKIEILGIAAHVLGDLRRQFARRAHHQHPARGVHPPLGIGRQTVQRGERERGGLAGAGLRNAKQIAALQQRRNGLHLDRGGIGIALGFKRTEKRLGEPKVGKIRHNKNLFLGRNPLMLSWSKHQKYSRAHAGNRRGWTGASSATLRDKGGW